MPFLRSNEHTATKYWCALTGPCQSFALNDLNAVASDILDAGASASGPRQPWRPRVAVLR